MKKCPYCAEEIQDLAVKCRFCGEFLEKKPQGQWYFKTSILLIAFLSVGPLALPLVWFNPRYSRNSKTIITVIVIVLSYFLGIMFINSLRSLSKYYQMIL